MIEWKNYDPNNPPDADNEYLVSDGRHVDIAYLMETGYGDEIRFYPPDRSPLGYDDIVYFAEINLPGEDTHGTSK